jgi:hypothetical protein
MPYKCYKCYVMENNWEDVFFQILTIDNINIYRCIDLYECNTRLRKIKKNLKKITSEKNNRIYRKRYGYNNKYSKEGSLKFSFGISYHNLIELYKNRKRHTTHYYQKNTNIIYRYCWPTNEWCRSMK